MTLTSRIVVSDKTPGEIRVRIYDVEPRATALTGRVAEITISPLRALQIAQKLMETAILHLERGEKI